MEREDSVSTVLQSDGAEFRARSPFRFTGPRFLSEGARQPSGQGVVSAQDDDKPVGGKSVILTEFQKKSLKWKIAEDGGVSAEREKPYPSQSLKWKIEGRHAQKGELVHLKRRQRQGETVIDHYLINLEDEPTVSYEVQKIQFSPAVKGCYESESERVKSFSAPHCPSTLSEKAAEFARAGFYYLGHSDAVKCFACGVMVYQWEGRDDMRKDHLKWIGNACGYMRKMFPELF